MLEDIQAAIPLGFFLAFMIGPVFFVLIETSVTKGFRAAVAFDLGVIVADIIFIGLAYFSSFQLLENLSNQPGFYVFGGLFYRLWSYFFLKNQNTTSFKSTLYSSKTNYIELFVKGFLLNFINIGVFIFWLGLLLLQGQVLENDINGFMYFLAPYYCLFFTDLFKIVLAKQLKKQLTLKILKIKKF